MSHEEVVGKTVMAAKNSSTVEQHLIDHHGVAYNWGAAGPCSDSPIAVHNMLHWPTRSPNHDHVRPAPHRR